MVIRSAPPVFLWFSCYYHYTRFGEVLLFSTLKIIGRQGLWVMKFIRYDKKINPYFLSTKWWKRFKKGSFYGKWTTRHLANAWSGSFSTPRRKHSFVSLSVTSGSPCPRCPTFRSSFRTLDILRMEGTAWFSHFLSPCNPIYPVIKERHRLILSKCRTIEQAKPVLVRSQFISHFHSV